MHIPFLQVRPVVARLKLDRLCCFADGVLMLAELEIRRRAADVNLDILGIGLRGLRGSEQHFQSLGSRQVSRQFSPVTGQIHWSGTAWRVCALGSQDPKTNHPQKWVDDTFESGVL